MYSFTFPLIFLSISVFAWTTSELWTKVVTSDSGAPGAVVKPEEDSDCIIYWLKSGNFQSFSHSLTQVSFISFVVSFKALSFLTCEISCLVLSLTFQADSS